MPSPDAVWGPELYWACSLLLLWRLKLGETKVCTGIEDDGEVGGEEYIVYWLYWHCLCYWTIYICCWGSLLIYDCWRKSGLKAGGKLLFINKYATHKSLCWAINKPHRTRLKQAGATNVIKCVSSQEERERKESESESEFCKVLCHVASCVYWPHFDTLGHVCSAVARLTLIR